MHRTIAIAFVVAVAIAIAGIVGSTSDGPGKWPRTVAVDAGL